VRWKRIEAKILEAIAHPLPTVMCFQEVSEDWAAELHVLFEQHGWHFAYAVTPMMQWPPLAVALAWPTSSFTLEEMKIRRPSAEIRVPPQPKLSGLRQLLHTLTLGRFGGFPNRSDPWKLASSKQNRVLMARLHDHRVGQSFVVATCHMPCLFGDALYRQAKAIHSAILRRSVLRFAGRLDVVLAGDFNTTPHDSELLLVQKGSMNEEDIARPAPEHGLHLGRWLPSESMKGKSEGCLRSAYADALGQEPHFTNYAWVEGQDEPFQQTIDYILVSEHVEVEGVQALPKVDLGDPVFPSAAQPSDHVFLAADVWIGGRSA
jgi:endonuclease/exonuclease/phosphatase family metal-dependent hydrolase